MMQQNFKKLFETGERVAGLFFNAACPEVLEIAAYAGFKFGIIDNEHGSWDGATHAHMIRAADAAGMVPIVRVSRIDETEIKKALDCGAAGVMIPGVSSVEDAKLALKYSKFAPVGMRGACPYVRANQFSAGDKTKYFDECNKEQVVIMLIEGKGGLESFDDIIALEGVNCVFFGPCDLAVSLGHPGEDDHPEVIAAIKDMTARARAKGVYTGMLGFDGKNSRYWLDKGADYVCALSDVGLFFEVCKKTMREINE